MHRSRLISLLVLLFFATPNLSNGLGVERVKRVRKRFSPLKTCEVG